MFRWCGECLSNWSLFFSCWCGPWVFGKRPDPATLTPTQRIEDANRRSKQYSRIVRGYIFVVFFVYSAYVLTEAALSIYNATCPYQIMRRGRPVSTGRCTPINSNIPAWSWESPYNTGIQIACIMVPRLITSLCAWASFSLFFAVLLNFKQEPDYELKDFLEVERYPTVDVLLPRYKEPWSLFAPTVAAALALDYPEDRLRVYVLDDGREAELLDNLVHQMNLGTRSNLFYITRPDGKDAKGGNLNNALQHSEGDLVVVFDADHICKPNFLLKTIPHMLEQAKGSDIWDFGNTAYVQTAQRFYNETDFLVRLLDGGHRIFYTLYMPGLSGLKAAPCVGTGYVMRRQCLVDIGGYVCGCAVEDVVTGLAMHSKGYSSKYLDVNLVEGLSPASLYEFYAQRLRWVAGSAQLLLYKRPMSVKNINFLVKIGYVSAHYYWMALLFFIALVWLRFIAWLVYLWVIGSTVLILPLASQYAPTVAFLFLPLITFRQKLEHLMSIFCFFPVYLAILWQWFTCRLNPKHNRLRVKASSEAFGDAFPPLALWNVLTSLVMVAIAGLIMAPHFNLIKTTFDYLLVIFQLLLIWFFNFPVWYEICHMVVMTVYTRCKRPVDSTMPGGADHSTKVVEKVRSSDHEAFVPLSKQGSIKAVLQKALSRHNSMGV